MDTRERLAFGLAGFGQNLLLNVVNLYLLVYLVEGVGFSTAMIATLTVVLTAARIWDAVNDLVLGVVIDRTRTRWGRFRPYIVFSALPVAALSVALFAVPETLPPGWQVAYVGAIYLLWDVAYTLCDVPYWSLTNTIATDNRSRTALVSIARALGMLALALVTLFGVPVARALGGGDAGAGWLPTAVLAAAIGMGLFTLAFFGTREKVVPGGRPEPVREQLRAIGANRSLLLVLASSVLGFGRNVIQVGGAVIAAAVFGDEGMFSLLGGAIVVGTVLGAVLSPVLLARMSRRTLMIWSTWVSAAVYLALFLAGYGNLPVVLGLLAVSGVLIGIYAVTQTRMIGDSADDGERLTGLRSDGASFAGLTFVSKAAGAIATAVFGAFLVAAAYTKGAEVTDSMRDLLWMSITLVPAASCVLGLIPLHWYRVPEREMPDLLEAARSHAPGL